MISLTDHELLAQALMAERTQAAELARQRQLLPRPKPRLKANIARMLAWAALRIDPDVVRSGERQEGAPPPPTAVDLGHVRSSS